MKHAEIVERARAAFREDAEAIPPLTLRGGNAVDGYYLPEPYDAETDLPTDKYLEDNFWGVAHLDADSWRHYLPRLIEYGLARMAEPGDLLVDSVLWSLRPPDREPPRLGSLSAEQEAVVRAFLEALAFDEASAYRDDAMIALEEYWWPRARYR